MKTPARTIIVGVDTPDGDTWPQVRWDYFASSSLSEDMAASTAYYRVLFVPPFDPECCVTVIDFGGAAEVSLLSYQTKLWNWVCFERLRANGKLLPTDRLPAAPQRWEEVAVLDAGRLRRFREELAPAPCLPEKMDCIVCDRMMVYCRFRRQAGEPQESTSWGASEPATHQLAITVHRLASEVLREAKSRKLLEAAKRYGP